MFFDSRNIICDETFCTHSQIWLCVQNFSSEKMNKHVWDQSFIRSRRKLDFAKSVVRRFTVHPLIVRMRIVSDMGETYQAASSLWRKCFLINYRRYLTWHCFFLVKLHTVLKLRPLFYECTAIHQFFLQKSPNWRDASFSQASFSHFIICAATMPYWSN